ncbi:MAG: peptidoglycan-associated lipoprotein Pal [candidate division NC10 bacterium]|nr:peptidoglycan-associated lipoprotein Pal [candidate division NC10 bacterium]
MPPPLVAVPPEEVRPPEGEKLPPKVPPMARPPEKPVVPHVRTLEDVFFDFDRYLIRDDARQTLDQNVWWLQEHPETRILIEGHCDERGTHEYNLALGEQRAKAVMEYLVASGIEPSRLSTISFGEEKPFVLGHDESAWRWNRRAHFVISLE